MLSDYFIALFVTLLIVGLFTSYRKFSNQSPIMSVQPAEPTNSGSWWPHKSQLTQSKKPLEVISLYPISTGLTETTEMLNRAQILDISLTPTDKSFGYMFDAVSLGHVKCILSPFNYGTRSSLPNGVDLYSNYPFGLNDYWKIKWLFQTKSGQGIQRLNNLLKKYNTYALPILVLPSQVTGWTNQTLSNSRETWKTLKMRTFGFAEEIYRRLGAETSTMTVQEIPEAYRTGKINFYEFSILTIDISQGLHQLGAKNYYISGYMEPSTVIYLIFNLDYWNSLTVNEKQILTDNAHVNLEKYLRQSDFDQKKALTQITNAGVKVLQVPPNALLAVYEEWKKFVAEKRQNDNFFDETLKDFETFIAEEIYWDDVTGSWQDLIKWQNLGGIPP